MTHTEGEVIDNFDRFREVLRQQIVAGSPRYMLATGDAIRWYRTYNPFLLESGDSHPLRLSDPAEQAAVTKWTLSDMAPGCAAYVTLSDLGSAASHDDRLFALPAWRAPALIYGLDNPQMLNALYLRLAGPDYTRRQEAINQEYQQQQEIDRMNRFADDILGGDQ